MNPALESKFAPPWVQFCKEYGEMPLLYGPTVENLYATLAKMGETIVSRFEIPPTDTSVKSEDIQVNENYRVRVYHPPGATGSDHLGMYLHAGGWTLGNLDIEDALCRLISKTVNMVLVSVDYRLAPKHKYPAALDDCVHAFEWAIANASKLGVRDTKVTIIGGSAGANLALGSALRLIDEGKGAPISGVIAQVPATIHPDAVPASLRDKFTSMEENADLSLATKSSMLAFWHAYDPPKDNIYTSCLLHPRLESLPKMYITECGMDTLRDDARLFRDAIEAAGVQYRYEAFEGYPHWSWTFPSRSLSAHSADYFSKLFNAINWTLI